MKKYAFLLMPALLGACILLKAHYIPTAKAEDQKMVEAAILDYVEGVYEVDPSRIERSVHPTLRKRGFYFEKDKNAYSGQLDMSYEQLVHLAKTWNKEGKRANAKSPKKIEVFDVLDKTAVGKLTAEWGVDYFHLAKLDGKWYIMNVIWQSPPQPAK
ncbi:MAG: nuclear transport factor 2 family protein [Saprospiraceae bacterium]